MMSCAHINNQSVNSSDEITKYSNSNQSKRNYSSIDSSPYDGEALIRSLLNKTSVKYFKKSVVEYLNSEIFSNKLTDIEKKNLEAFYTNPLSKNYAELTAHLGEKYKQLLEKNLEDDEDFNGPSELNLYLVFRINQFFYLEEVQKELIETVFTAQRKEKLFGYFNLIKNSIMQKVTPKFNNNWNGQMSFYEVVKSTELFWPDFNYLRPFFKKTTFKNHYVRSVDESDHDGQEISQIYLRYLKMGYAFYTTSNASFGYFGYVDSFKQAMLVQPVFFTQIKNNFVKDFSIIGILAHELGHGAGYFSRKQFENTYKPTAENISYFENKILLPFYSCYTLGRNELDYARIQYQETRSDYIAFLVMKDFKDSLGIDNEAIYLDMINLFRKHTTEKIRLDMDPHPPLDNRDRIVSGQCQLKEIYPYTNYNEGP